MGDAGRQQAQEGNGAQTRGWFRTLDIVTPITPEALDGYYAHARDGLLGDMDFLRRPIARRRFFSNALKLLALLALAVGILMPILQPEEIEAGWFEDRSGAEVALAAVAAGGLLLLLDRLFNVSASWTRLMLSELQIQKLLIRLQYDWAKRRPLLTNANVAAEGPAMIDLLAAAAIEANVVMEAQKRSWATELDAAAAALAAQLESRQAELATVVEQQRTASRAGAINVALDKPDALEGAVRIVLDGKEVSNSAPPQASYALGNLAPGLATLGITAKRKGGAGTFAHQKAVTVAAGAILDVTVRVA